jgi:hypothetical protein
MILHTSEKLEHGVVARGVGVGGTTVVADVVHRHAGDNKIN